MDVAKAVITNGAAIITQDTNPRSTEQNTSNKYVPANPNTAFVPAIKNAPRDKSKPTCTMIYNKYKYAGGHKDSMKYIFTLFTFD
jgi:hypothetical protein